MAAQSLGMAAQSLRMAAQSLGMVSVLVQLSHSHSVKAVKNFTRSLKEYLNGVLAYCKHKIKAIKRIAFGCRDVKIFLPKDSVGIFYDLP